MAVATPTRLVGELYEVALRCDDLDRDIAFWTETMGLELQGRTERWASLKDPDSGQQVALINFTSDTPYAVLSVRTDDIHASIANMLERGADMRTDGSSGDEGMKYALMCSGQYPLLFWEAPDEQ